MATEERSESIFDMNQPSLEWLIDAVPKITAVKESQKKNKRVISFSLYNDADLYNYGVLLNYELNKSILKDWTVRVYFDDTANQRFINYVATLDVELFQVESFIPPMFYRFFPMVDSRVERFISRDLDSVISYRDEMMVEEWVKSGKRLHLVHEVYPGHRHFVMGGMFGFKCDHSAHEVAISATPTPGAALTEADTFYYEPWKATVHIRIETDCMRFFCPDSPEKFFLIKSEDIPDFMLGREVSLNWQGSKILPCRLENNDRIAVAHDAGRVFYFSRDYDLQACDLFEAINLYYRQLGKKKFSYLDDQNFLHEYFGQYYNDCLDHNNMKELTWPYSVQFRHKHKRLNELHPHMTHHDIYLGHRVDTRETYEVCFNRDAPWSINTE